MGAGRRVRIADVVGLEDALANAGTGPTIHVGEDEPASPQNGDIWFVPVLNYPTLTGTLTALSGNGQVTLDWPNGTDTVGVVDYPVQYKANASSTWVDWTPTPTNSTQVINALNNNTLYDFRVCARNAAGRTSDWLTVSATPNLTVLFDFESGADGQALAAPWSIATGSAAAFDYDNAHALGTLAGRMVAAAGSTPYAEFASTQGMTANTAEIRGALYLPDATHFRQILDHNTNYWVALSALGELQVITDRTATGYTTGGWTTVGSYAPGWLYWRIVLNFTTDTYQLFTRTNEGAAWTQHKATGAADYNIPMKSATDRTSSGKLRFTCFDGDSIWFDNIQASNAGLA